MDRGTGDRAVSEVVGFILIFGMLVTAFTVYQGIVVPDQNRQVEFQHNQEVQGQMQDLRNAIVSTAATDSGQAVSVTLGASYPTRTLAMNLGVSAGSLQSTSGGSVRVDNVSTQDPETADYVSGSLGPFPTRSVRYTPVYSFYSEAPDTVYENSLVYNRFGDANLTITDQALVDGRTLTVVTVAGNLSASQRGTVSVNTRPVSVSSTRIPITSDGTGPVTVSVPSSLPPSTWQEILGEEYDPAGGPNEAGHVSEVRQAGNDRIQFVLESGVNYELRLAKIGVGSGAETPTAHYITSVSGNGSSVPTGGSEQLVVEVRDRYNNPVSGVEVNVSDGRGLVGEASVVSDGDGLARFTFNAPGTPGTETVTMNISDSPAAREQTTFSLSVQSVGGGGGGGSGAYEIAWEDPSGEPGTLFPCDANSCTWDVEADGDNRLALSASTDPPNIDGLEVDFALDDTGVATLVNVDSETDGGTATTTLQAAANGTVNLYVSAGGSSDKLTLDVQNVGGGLSFTSLNIADTTTDGFFARSEFEVSYSVDDPESQFENVTVEFQNLDSPSESETITRETTSDTITHTAGVFTREDDYSITVTLYDVDGNAVAVYSCSETGDGDDACGTLV